MRARILVATLTLMSLGAARPVAAQATLTLEVPLNLTQLSPKIVVVRVACELRGDALVNPTGPMASVLSHADSPVNGGQVVTTLKVVFTLSEGSVVGPTGRSFNYVCRLRGATSVNGAFIDFQETSPWPEFVLKPNPTANAGSFVW